MENIVPAVVLAAVLGVFIVAAGAIGGFLAGRGRE